MGAMAEERAAYAKAGDNMQKHMKALEQQMREAAADLDFEKAAELRDELKRLQDLDMAV